MSTDAQTQATEGQSAPVEGYEALNADEAIKLLRESDPETRERILDFERAHDSRKSVLEAGSRASKRRTDAEQRKVKLVKVRFDGATDPETALLDVGGWRLHKGQPVEVPEPVFEQLTQGDNAKLYRVAKVDD